MPSTLSWLDYSNAERRKMLEIIQLFSEQETRDELGLGTIRDSFADRLFPGTTTLQTRARYFLYVPWLFKSYEEKRLTGQKLHDQLRRDEIAIIDSFLRAKQTDGVIGQRSGRDLHRFPSSIYWLGLQSWGILSFSGTIYQYISSLPGYYHRLELLARRDERQPGENVRSNWDVYLPEPPNNFLSNTSFSLSYKESKYLQERLQYACSESLLAYLTLQQPHPFEIPFAWFHPAIHSAPEKLSRTIFHARNFSETMHGASLLYNYLLAKQKKDENLVDNYRDRLTMWRRQILLREKDLCNWNLVDFWDLADPHRRVHPNSIRFVTQWLSELIFKTSIADPLSNREMQILVKDREKQLKKGRSRFVSPRHLELWNGDAGTGQLDFRWGIAQRLLNDILKGLSGEQPNARSI